MMTKKKIYVEVYNSDSVKYSSLPISLIKFKDKLIEFIERIPEDSQDSAKIIIDTCADDDYKYVTIVISYERYETDEEYNKRLVKEELEKQYKLHHQEQQERQQLAQLKAKYGEKW